MKRQVGCHCRLADVPAGQGIYERYLFVLTAYEDFFAERGTGVGDPEQDAAPVPDNIHRVLVSLFCACTI